MKEGNKELIVFISLVFLIVIILIKGLLIGSPITVSFFIIGSFLSFSIGLLLSIVYNKITYKFLSKKNTYSCYCKY